MTGITAMAAFGHTPGHMAFHLESDGQRMVITADTANHHVWSLQHPDWEVRFDADKAAAAAARKTVFGMIAADRIPLAGYHMPFPAQGYVEPAGEGFCFVPAGLPVDVVGECQGAAPQAALVSRCGRISPSAWLRTAPDVGPAPRPPSALPRRTCPA